MLRKGSAFLMLAMLATAIVPGGLASLRQDASQACCRAGRCPMPAGSLHKMGSDHAMHCKGPSDAAPLQGMSTCLCQMSGSSRTIVPPTAFRFNLQLASSGILRRPHYHLDTLSAPTALALQGYSPFIDQPPRT